MKTKTKKTTKKYHKPASIPARKSNDNPGLNSDEQARRTNTSDEEDTIDEGANRILPREDDLVEDDELVREEEREKQRRVDEARGEQEN